MPETNSDKSPRGDTAAAAADFCRAKNQAATGERKLAAGAALYCRRRRAYLRKSICCRRGFARETSRGERREIFPGANNCHCVFAAAAGSSARNGFVIDRRRRRVFVFGGGGGGARDKLGGQVHFVGDMTPARSVSAAYRQPVRYLLAGGQPLERPTSPVAAAQIVALIGRSIGRRILRAPVVFRRPAPRKSSFARLMGPFGDARKCVRICAHSSLFGRQVTATWDLPERRR